VGYDPDHKLIVVGAGFASLDMFTMQVSRTTTPRTGNQSRS
jgi:hypothetical protein